MPQGTKDFVVRRRPTIGEVEEWIWASDRVVAGGGHRNTEKQHVVGSKEKTGFSPGDSISHLPVILTLHFLCHMDDVQLCKCVQTRNCSHLTCSNIKPKHAHLHGTLVIDATVCMLT